MDATRDITQHSGAKPSRSIRKSRAYIATLAGIAVCFLVAVHTEKISPDLLPAINQKENPFFYRIAEGVILQGAERAFRFCQYTAEAMWAIASATPWKDPLAAECLALSQLSRAAAQRTAAFAIQKPSILPTQSWESYKLDLDRLPAKSWKEQETLSFLKRRWLMKVNGFYFAESRVLGPSFGYPIQVHPDSTNCYIRDPGNVMSKTYQKRIESWKGILPHPRFYPMILTRPADVMEYLPPRINVYPTDRIKDVAQSAARLLSKTYSEFILLDLTGVLPITNTSRGEWLSNWDLYRTHLLHELKNLGAASERILCVEQLKKGGLGAIRILPFSDGAAEHGHRALLTWIGHFGLSANLVELDRAPLEPDELSPSIAIAAAPLPTQIEIKERLASFERNWHSSRLERTTMALGAYAIIKDLFDSIPHRKWKEPPPIAAYSFGKIAEEFDGLIQEGDSSPFIETYGRIEKILSHAGALLEVFSPYTISDFHSIYLDRLVSIPASLRPMTRCALHASGMTSIAGLFKGAEKMDGAPFVLYGENTYFECAILVREAAQGGPAETASEEDWKKCNLLLAQFNPVLRRGTGIEVDKYRVEPIAEYIRKALYAREGRPFTLALDVTIEKIDSPRVGELLAQFQNEISSGLFNVAAYRSGLKFDLFGMDNYSGAPFYMIDNGDPKWEPFNSLITDPALVTDLLSHNWFSAAFHSAASYLDGYRQLIFSNSRALLDRAPKRLFDKTMDYRLIPFHPDAEVSFIDFHTSGFLHPIKASIVAGYLYLFGMTRGFPVYYRRSIGFHHPNFGILFGNDYSTLRLTVGLDPRQVDLFAECFEIFERLNGKSP